MLIILFLIILVIFLLPKYPTPKIMHNFITPEERHHIMKVAEPKLKPSRVGNHRIDTDVRVSETAWLDINTDPIIHNVIRRCLKLTDRPIINCEKLQVLRYKPGGYYKPHQDAFFNDQNPRLYTFILALNDDYENGETSFPNLNREYKLVAGDALFFETLDNYELHTSKALHGGRPVEQGEKWICNLWIRKYPYN